MSWHEGILCAFDLETTGVDVESARIVTACVARVDGSGRARPAVRKWLVNPGVEIPAEATKVHRVTTEQARAEGQDPGPVVAEIVDMLARALERGVPIVGFNVGQFDLTLLDREARRYGLPTLTDAAGDVAPVIDAMVLDKHVEKFRRGKGRRTLTACCEIYGVRLDEAHEASADAWAAAGVACRIGERYPKAGRLSLAELHELQVTAKAEQDADLADYFRKQARTAKTADEQLDLHARADSCAGHWPLIPYAQQGAMA